MTTFGQIPSNVPFSNFQVVTSSTRPSSPDEGDTIYETDTDKLLIFNGTDWTQPPNLPWGMLGYSQTTSNQLDITSETDLTNLSVTVTVDANRRIRISTHGRILSNSSGDFCTGRIKEGTTQLAMWVRLKNESGGNIDIIGNGSVVLTPASGSHTYKLTLERVSGTGNVDLRAATDDPAYIIVEDIGPA